LPFSAETMQVIRSLRPRRPKSQDKLSNLDKLSTYQRWATSGATWEASGPLGTSAIQLKDVTGWGAVR